MSFIRGTPLTQEVAQLLGVAVDKSLSISDSQDNIIQVHYNDATKYPDHRGWIIDMDSKRLIARSFGFSEEKVVALEDLPEVPMTIAKEGTILRVYTRDEKLCVSTHRRLDCKNSKWMSSKTFYDMFLEACDAHKIVPDSLKSDKCYVLLLVHPENQIVNQEVITPTLYHLDTWETSEEVTSQCLHLMKRCVVDLGLPVPGQATKEEILEAWASGKVLITMDDKKVKYLSKGASERYQLRGNHPNIKMQWYTLRGQGKHKKLVDVLPLAFKSLVEDYDKERVSLEREILDHYLVHLYYQQVMKKAKYDLTIGDVEWKLLDMVQQKYYEEKNGDKTFFWGKNKKSTYNKVAGEMKIALNKLDGVELYRCLFDFVKYKKHQVYLEKPMLGYADIPN